MMEEFAWRDADTTTLGHRSISSTKRETGQQDRPDRGIVIPTENAGIGDD
jgi:hypothetical protein